MEQSHGEGGGPPTESIIRIDGINLSSPEAPLQLYQKLRDNALKGEAMDVGVFLTDLADLNLTGAIDQTPELGERILKAGEDPLLWLEVYQRARKSVQEGDVPQTARNLRLAHLLGMDRDYPDDQNRQIVADQINTWKGTFAQTDAERTTTSSPPEPPGLPEAPSATETRGEDDFPTMPYDQLTERANTLAPEQLAQIPGVKVWALIRDGYLTWEQITKLPVSDQIRTLVSKELDQYLANPSAAGASTYEQLEQLQARINDGSLQPSQLLEIAIFAVQQQFNLAKKYGFPPNFFGRLPSNPDFKAQRRLGGLWSPSEKAQADANKDRTKYDLLSGIQNQDIVRLYEDTVRGSISWVIKMYDDYMEPLLTGVPASENRAYVREYWKDIISSNRTLRLAGLVDKAPASLLAKYPELLEEPPAAEPAAKSPSSPAETGRSLTDAELLERAGALARERGSPVSASLLQRELEIGYVAAATLVEQLRDQGVKIDDQDESLTEQQAPTRQEAHMLIGKDGPFHDSISLFRRHSQQIRAVDSVAYANNRVLPPGLGKWIPQSPELEGAFPKTPAKWVEEPPPGTQLVVKRLLTSSSEERKRLNNERDNFLLANAVFPESGSRPARIYGYGVNQEEQVYLLLEFVTGEFKQMDRYLTERGGVLDQQEALEFSLELVKTMIPFLMRGLKHFDIDVVGESNIFWDSVNKQIRLIDLETISQGVKIDDIPSVGKILFTIITGKDYESTMRPIREEALGTTTNQGGNFESVYSKSLNNEFKQIDPLIGTVIRKACRLESNEAPYSYDLLGIRDLYLDLKAALVSLTGQDTDQLAQLLQSEIEWTGILRDIAQRLEEQNPTLSGYTHKDYITQTSDDLVELALQQAIAVDPNIPQRNESIHSIINKHWGFREQYAMKEMSKKLNERLNTLQRKAGSLKST